MPKSHKPQKQQARERQVVRSVGGVLAVGVAIMLAMLMPGPSGLPNDNPEEAKAYDDLGNANTVVRSSRMQNAGLGAFAIREFQKGDLLGIFRCEVYEKDGTPLGPYSFAISATHACGAENITSRNPMRYVNSVAELPSCGRQNVQRRLRPERPDAPVVYFATRDVAVGEELLLDYGEAYFKRRAELFPASVRYECGAEGARHGAGFVELDEAGHDEFEDMPT